MNWIKQWICFKHHHFRLAWKLRNSRHVVIKLAGGTWWLISNFIASVRVHTYDATYALWGPFILNIFDFYTLWILIMYCTLDFWKLKKCNNIALYFGEKICPFLKIFLAAINFFMSIFASGPQIIKPHYFLNYDFLNINRSHKYYGPVSS